MFLERRKVTMNSEKELVARLLLDIGALHYDDANPFVFTSNTVSPVYVDIRKLISFPSQRKAVIGVARALIERVMGNEKIDVIAGGETAGIPYAAWLADEMCLPMVYVRKMSKGFGRQSQIEGHLPTGASVLLVEDLMFDAQSKINFCQAIRREHAHVEHALVIFDYGYSVSRENLAKNNIGLHALCDWPVLLEIGEQRRYFTSEQADVIRAFLADPQKWVKERQGILS
jgi:orotate phosphoribosyltransferase